MAFFLGVECVREPFRQDSKYASPRITVSIFYTTRLHPPRAQTKSIQLPILFKTILFSCEKLKLGPSNSLRDGQYDHPRR